MAMIIMSIQNTFGRKTYNATICSDMCSFRECALAFHMSSSCRLHSDPPQADDVATGWPVRPCGSLCRTVGWKPVRTCIYALACCKGAHGVQTLTFFSCAVLASSVLVDTSPAPAACKKPAVDLVASNACFRCHLKSSVLNREARGAQHGHKHVPMPVRRGSWRTAIAEILTCGIIHNSKQHAWLREFFLLR